MEGYIQLRCIHQLQIAHFTYITIRRIANPCNLWPIMVL